MNWKEASYKVIWNIRPFIGGSYRYSASRADLPDIDPATEIELARVPVGDAADVDEAVRVARERFEDGCWSELPPGRRAEVLVRLANLICEHRLELALLDTLEMGKPILQALNDSEISAPRLLRSWAGFVDKLWGVSAPLSSDMLAFNTYEPRGVVAAITPWNFPCVNAVYKFGPALAAGNTVVLKPSEVAPSSALRLAELAIEAGVPEGVLNIVPGLGSTVGSALAVHRDVDMVSFTGSTATGRKVMEMCGSSNGKAVILECGGKSPQVVFDDAEDVDAVADATVRSVLWNQGQVCGAHTRLIVHKAVKSALLQKVLERASHCRPGDPLDERTTFGPLASPAQRDRVRSFIQQGLRGGAVALLRGAIQDTGGCYVCPTIFDCVDSKMSIVQEEIFGPVLCVQQFSTEAEAIELANGTQYGLSATVWTRNLARGRRLAHAIRAGNVTVRTGGVEGSDSGYILTREPRKASGFGAELGVGGLQSYSTLKSVAFLGA